MDEDRNSDTHQYGIYDPLSVTQTEWICSSFSSLLQYLATSTKDEHKPTAEKIATSLLSFLKQWVDKMTVPIIKTDNVAFASGRFANNKDNLSGYDGETSDAIAFAIYTQARELCTLTSNIIGHWYPMLIETIHSSNQENIASLVQFVLMEIISLRLLPITQTLKVVGRSEDQIFADLPKQLIGEVLNVVTDAGLLIKDEFMMYAAPLRASSQAMGLVISQ
jgi:hypothetical protein